MLVNWWSASKLVKEQHMQAKELYMPQVLCCGLVGGSYWTCDILRSVLSLFASFMYFSQYVTCSELDMFFLLIFQLFLFYSNLTFKDANAPMCASTNHAGLCFLVQFNSVQVCATHNRNECASQRLRWCVLLSLLFLYISYCFSGRYLVVLLNGRSVQDLV